MINVGYCCLNVTLGDQGIRPSRSMIKRTFDERGVSYASELGLQNVKDLKTIVQWNIDNNIKVFRLSSDLFPWHSEYSLSDLPDYDEIIKVMLEIGNLIDQSNMRVSFHPDHFVKLASDKSDLVDQSLLELEHHSELMDLMNLPRSYECPINIHVGGAYGDKAASLTRFRSSLDRLSDATRQRLVVENDDKSGLFSVLELQGLDTPITFDYFHHSLYTDGVSLDDAFLMSYETWPTKPLFHYSDSRRDYEDKNARLTAHADYVYNQIEDFGFDIDVDLEAKAKELAVLRYRDVTKKG